MSKAITKLQCNRCNHYFSSKGGNYNRHIKSCDGLYTPKQKLNQCKYCCIDFSAFSQSHVANHSRWCIQNPNRGTGHSTGKQLNTPEAIEKRRIKIKEAHASGKYEGSAKKSLQTRIKNGNLYHSEAAKQLIREKALASPHRRLVRSIRPYIMKDGTTIMLDSSWEEVLARRLDEQGVNWNRPTTPIKYSLPDGSIHNYFPDFYLPEHNLYLDPKNPYAIKAQQQKVDTLLRVVNNLVILKTLEECLNFTI